MTDLYICVILISVGFIILGGTWVAIEGVAAFKTWQKHFRYLGRHTHAYREHVNRSPSMIWKEAEEIGSLYFMATVQAEREFLETRKLQSIYWESD